MNKHSSNSIQKSGQFNIVDNKQDQKRQIFNMLEQHLTPDHTIEYAYFGFIDKYCYDLRRDVTISSTFKLQHSHYFVNFYIYRRHIDQ
jgi:hypothetical protein